MSELHIMTIAETARMIESRELSPLELVKSLLERIETFDRQTNAFITVTAERAIDQARKAEAEIQAGRYRGPLHGIPFGLKDIFDTAGVRTTGHSKVYLDHVPERDAATVTKLHEAGAILLGKLATHELAHGGPSFDLPWPPARNPWHIERFTGGSSSGSAAAVAAGFVPGALGSDTGGSIRTPASLCGIVGLKPTFGLVSRRGVIPNSFSLDHCGPMARTVEDCAVMLQAIAGFDPIDPASADRAIPDYRAALTGDIRGLRVGVVRHFWEEDQPANEELRAATEKALEVLSGLGARLKDVRMRSIQDYYDHWNVIEEPEIFSVHRKTLVERPQDFGSVFLGRTLAACLIQAADYMEAQRERRRMLGEMQSLYAECDVLVATGAGPAPVLDSRLVAWPKPNPFVPFNMTGGPALVLRSGFSKDGLPLSMQLAGRPFDEVNVLRAAHAYETAAGWRERRPVLTEGTVPEPIACVPAPLSSSGVDTTTRELCIRSAERAGLRLTESQLAQLCAKAPHLLAMVERARRFHGRDEEPASAFSLRDANSALA